jgi:hypothetical protein
MQRRKEMSSSTNSRAVHFGTIVFLYITTYLICRYIFDVNGIFPVYTPGWTGRHFLWFAALVSTLPVLFGWFRFPYITFAGFILGNVVGELFGGFRSDIPPQYLHYGWLICIVVLLLSCAVGAYIEHLNKKKRKK